MKKRTVLSLTTTALVVLCLVLLCSIVNKPKENGQLDRDVGKLVAMVEETSQCIRSIDSDQEFLEKLPLLQPRFSRISILNRRIANNSEAWTSGSKHSSRLSSAMDDLKDNTLHLIARSQNRDILQPLISFIKEQVGNAKNPRLQSLGR